MDKHTPGPWIVDGSHTRDLVVGVGRDDDRLLACPGTGGAMSWTDKVCTMSWSGGEHEANARLIAAAPDLLSAAKMIAQWVEVWPETHPVDAWDALRAAIAKAEGRS